MVKRELIDAIGRLVTGWNERACPFVWTKDADQVFAKTDTHKPTSETEH